MRPQRLRPTPERFAELQTAAKRTRDTWTDYKAGLDRKYQSAQYAPAAKRRQLEQLARAERRAWERFWEYLHAISPRDWSAGIPCHWLIDGLRYNDAVTYGPLSVVPPAAFGWDTRDAAFQRIIGPLRPEGEVQAHG